MLANKIVNKQQIENAELEGKDPVKPRSNAKRVGKAMKAAADRDAACYRRRALTLSGYREAFGSGIVRQNLTYGQCNGRHSMPLIALDSRLV